MNTPIRFVSSNLMGCLLIALTSSVGLAQWEGVRHQQMLKELQEAFGEPKNMVRLDPVSRVWADSKNHRVVVDGYVALRSGQLEMLACLVGTKEHESVVAVFTKARFVHAGLLAVGAKQGKPVQWQPEYAPPTGSKVRVVALWRDKDGKKHAMDARKWVRDASAENKVLESNFVFAGSMMYTDPETKVQSYEAEQGDLICVANFSSATLDVPLRSLKASSMLSFVAYTERIPESGTPVRLVLEVVSEDAKKEASESKELVPGTPPAKLPGEAAAVKLESSVPDTAASPVATSEIALASYQQLLAGPKKAAATASSNAPLPAPHSGDAPLE